MQLFMRVCLEEIPNERRTPKPTWKISKPAMSRMPMKEAPCLCLRSRALFIRWTSHLNRRSYVALARASTAKSAWRQRRGQRSDNGAKWFYSIKLDLYSP